ncbi:MAG: YegS/Rv2252/BmrU family lipid kinase [Candidatus Heimdallarchaeota archaeon]|nr:YegS/Rv2252/BmrU family lipid kinase [Candidatus Heimdallarchaeota archaeon]MCK4878082.1 YegS/Rv2252/BmrU family lipid kinase [Candidatus Heimdallarchaeota archaeon]
MSDKWKFIVNPNAGSSLCSKRWVKAEPVIKKSGIDYDVIFTEKRAQGQELTKQAINDGFNRIIVASGDGVVNEAINGIMSFPEQKRKSVAFGVLPFGTGNDLCTYMGIPWDPENAAKTLIEKTAVSPSSIGKIKYHDTKFEVFFGNMFDFGISSLVNLGNLNGEMSWIKGPSKYTFLALKKLVTVKQRKGEIRLDDGEWMDFKLMLVAIGIGKAVGGGMLACVNAHPQNDFFDVMISKDMTKFQTLLGIQKIFKGEHLNLKGVQYKYAKKVEVKLESPIGMEHDGEIYEGDVSAHVEVNIMPRAYNILYNTEHPSMYWLSDEELDAGKKPDGVATKGMTHWDGRTWMEKN